MAKERYLLGRRKAVKKVHLSRGNNTPDSKAIRTELYLENNNMIQC